MSNEAKKVTFGDYAEACIRLHEACGRLRIKLDEMRAQELADEAAKLPPLLDGEIEVIAHGMPGGIDGFLKGWGWQQFARAIERAHGIGKQSEH